MALDDSQAKLGRAKVHLDALEQSIKSFLGRDPFPVIVEAQSDLGRYVIKLQNPAPLPMREWAVIIGDCVHNLRSALDYIAWALAGSRDGDTVTMFPIFIDREKYKNARTQRIGNVSGPAQRLIESFQPYHSPDPKLTPLWAIGKLDKVDKHRLLIVAAGIPGEIALPLSFPPYYAGHYKMSLFPNVAFEHDAVVAEVTFIPPNPQLEINARLTPEIAFGETTGLGLHAFVLPNLAAMIGQVELMIGKFELLFKEQDERTT